MSCFTESVVEEAALDWLEGFGYTILKGINFAPEEPAAERENYSQVILEGRLKQALQSLNHEIPSDALEEAFRKLTRLDSPSLVSNNHQFHKFLIEGIPDVDEVDRRGNACVKSPRELRCY